MPKLGNTATQRLNLPSSTEDDIAYVDVKSELLVSDLAAISSETDQMKQAIVLLSRVIVDWNFTDKDGNKVEPTEEWVSQLPTDDFVFLSEWISGIFSSQTEGLSKGEKKDSLSDSIPIVVKNSPPTI